MSPIAILWAAYVYSTYTWRDLLESERSGELPATIIVRGALMIGSSVIAIIGSTSTEGTDGAGILELSQLLACTFVVYNTVKLIGLFLKLFDEAGL